MAQVEVCFGAGGNRYLAQVKVYLGAGEIFYRGPAPPKRIGPHFVAQVSNPATSGIMTDEKKKERYYMIMDRLFDLLDKYEIQIVACMSFISGAFVAEGENAWNLVCEKDSESRKNLVKYIGESGNKEPIIGCCLHIST